MMRRVVNFLRLDLTLSLRDSLAVYSLISPLLLAVIIRLMVPSVQDATFTMAVHAEIDGSVIERLGEYGTVELFPTREEVIERVGRNDNVPGVYLQAGEYRLVLEGNEGA